MLCKLTGFDLLPQFRIYILEHGSADLYTQRSRSREKKKRLSLRSFTILPKALPVVITWVFIIFTSCQMISARL